MIVDYWCYSISVDSAAALNGRLQEASRTRLCRYPVTSSMLASASVTFVSSFSCTRATASRVIKEVVQFRDAATNKYVAACVDGKVRFY